ncbi:DegT/DnrJ/EryC1/StrS family aminotransferase [Longispora sp. K20-0274]|uniref:DegT/DnrJ/EryC1/StrS family aminotransferase n=1 Tax=Longispora sp. K20-0274 TaxID=3088255 RepID=UPI003999A016
MIPFHTTDRQHRALLPELEAALTGVGVIDDARPKDVIAEFEDKLALYCGSRYAVATGSGTDALTMALMALDLPAGSEVITGAFGFFATALAIIRAGHVPVFVDTTHDGFLLDPGVVISAITSRTAAIVPVHLYGEAANLTALRTIADRHGCVIVEDAAQALGARWEDRPVGTVGAAGIFSFNWSKHLSGRTNGGAAVTDDPKVAERITSLRRYGAEQGFTHTTLGFNSTLNPYEAAILGVKLPHLDRWIARRATIADRYARQLAGVDGLRIPAPGPAGGHAFHKFTIRAADRDGLRAHLKAAGITAMIFYPGLLHEQPALDRAEFRVAKLVHAPGLPGEVLSLPIYPELTDAEVDRICAEIVAFHA